MLVVFVRDLIQHTCTLVRDFIQHTCTLFLLLSYSDVYSFCFSSILNYDQSFGYVKLLIQPLFAVMLLRMSQLQPRGTSFLLVRPFRPSTCLFFRLCPTGCMCIQSTLAKKTVYTVGARKEKRRKTGHARKSAGLLPLLLVILY